MNISLPGLQRVQSSEGAPCALAGLDPLEAWQADAHDASDASVRVLRQFLHGYLQSFGMARAQAFRV